MITCRCNLCAHGCASVFSHNGGQGCMLQGSSSGTGLAAESHFLSGTSSSVWRSTQWMTLNWEPTGGQTDEMTWQQVLVPTDQKGETFANPEGQRFICLIRHFKFEFRRLEKELIVTFATGSCTFSESTSPPYKRRLSVQWQVGARRDPCVPVGRQASRSGTIG